MTYALISDTHGNLPALKSVLDDIATHEVDAIIFCGDYYCDFPYPNETLDLIRSVKKKTYVIRGNKEDYLSEIIGDDKYYIQFEALYWNNRVFRKDNLDYLRELPEEIQVHDGRIHVAHGQYVLFKNPTLKKLSSSKYRKRIEEGKDSREVFLKYVKKLLDSDPALQDILNEREEDIFIYGHSHVQWYYVSPNGKIIVNPGSCGLPLDSDNKAAYTLLTLENDKVGIEEKRVAYDIETMIDYIKGTDFYSSCPAWNEVMFKQVRTGLDYIQEFFQGVEEMAIALRDDERPYSIEVWEKASEKWLEKNK